jgi:hypothetical protein
VVIATRAQVLNFRVRAQQLDRDPGTAGRRPAGAAGPDITVGDIAVLDIGVQDTGPDGAGWALAIRGVDGSTRSSDELIMLWTVRGAPHVYRRADLPWVAAAVQPFSDADAGKRIYDAARPLKAAGVGNLAGLDTVAAAMRSVVTAPMSKGEVSARLTELLPPPYLRFCRPCDATHPYEMPFRLAALRAGLELRAGTSPPVLQPVPGFHRAAETHRRLDLVRAYLRLLGPATPRHVADYLDAPVTDVKARWPSDVVEVVVDGQPRWVLAADEDQLTAEPARVTRLLGPFDLFLQARDRPLLVSDRARAKELWPVLGRPGAVLVDGEILGTWRPRQASGKLKIQFELWAPVPPTVRGAIAAEAGRLASHRGVQLGDLLW